MLFQRFFKQPKPNKFGYSPVYYDERKIDRERKMKEAARENGEGDSESTSKESVDFRNTFKRDVKLARNSSLNKFRSKQSAKSNRMVFIILFLILALIYVQIKF